MTRKVDNSFYFVIPVKPGYIDPVHMTGKGKAVVHVPLNNKLKEYRSRLGVDQQDMGKMVGTSRQTISQIERGDYSPSVTLALKIAKVCGVTVEDIFQYEEEES